MPAVPVIFGGVSALASTRWGRVRAPHIFSGQNPVNRDGRLTYPRVNGSSVPGAPAVVQIQSQGTGLGT